MACSQYEKRRIKGCGGNSIENRISGGNKKNSIHAKRLIEDETMVARVSIPIFEGKSCPGGMDDMAFVTTTIIRKTVEVSNSRLTEEKAAEMNEAKSRTHRADPGGSNQ